DQTVPLQSAESLEAPPGRKKVQRPLDESRCLASPRSRWPSRQGRISRPPCARPLSQLGRRSAARHFKNAAIFVSIDDIGAVVSSNLTFFRLALPAPTLDTCALPLRFKPPGPVADRRRAIHKTRPAELFRPLFPSICARKTVNLTQNRAQRGFRAANLACQ